jgi:biopolymer transport protein ExbB/TolQ
MANNGSSRSTRRPMPWVSRLVTYAGVLLIGFLLAFVPMWLKAGASATNLSAAIRRAGQVQAQSDLASTASAHQLELARMQNTLASAEIDAQRGDYEAARIAASSFFTSLREEANKGTDSSLSQAQKAAVEPMFAGRDEIISLLARSDPAATQRLSDLYVSFRELVAK